MAYDPFEVVDVAPAPMKRKPAPMKRKLPFPVRPGYFAVEEEAPSAFEKPYPGAPAHNATSGAPLKTASERRQARPPAAHPQRPEATLGQNSGCRSLLVRCRRDAEKAAETEDEASRNVEAALAEVAELQLLVSRNSAAEKELKGAYAAAGIKTTKRTGNPFTPLVKLVFPKKAQTPATVSRYASVLRLAEEEGIRPSGLADFVRRNGGLAACATRAAEKRRSAAGGSRQGGTAAAEVLMARRRNAPNLAPPPGVQLPNEGLTLLLVESGPDGSCLLLGQRRAPAGAVMSSSPVSARLTKPAEGRRG